MPIDRDKAINADMPASECHYGPDDVILYHLGVGAGSNGKATDEKELEYTFEKNLKVLPSYAVVASKNSTGGGMSFRGLPGLEFNLASLLHGEQEIELHQPLPTQAKFSMKPKIEEVYDKGKAALVYMANTATDENGQPLFTSRMGLFIRGEGGFGGESGPKAGNAKPERDADGSVEVETHPEQALLYRLNGDKNPLHADPEFSKMAGFDVPIIHGLCSYGITCKAIVDNVLGGDVSKVKSYAARFAGVAFPGETYVVSWWNEGDKILVEAKSKQRDTVIISNAAITTR